jgi:hypothetical protein
MFDHGDLVSSIERKLSFESREAIDQGRNSAQHPQSIPPRPRREMLRVMRQSEGRHLNLVLRPQVFE